MYDTAKVANDPTDRLKATMAQQQMGQNACGCGSIGAETKSARPSLGERVRDQRYHAEAQVQRAMGLSELQHLLDKHPDVARILDLMELVR